MRSGTKKQSYIRYKSLHFKTHRTFGIKVYTEGTQAAIVVRIGIFFYLDAFLGCFFVLLATRARRAPKDTAQVQKRKSFIIGRIIQFYDLEMIFFFISRSEN